MIPSSGQLWVYTAIVMIPSTGQLWVYTAIVMIPSTGQMGVYTAIVMIPSTGQMRVYTTIVTSYSSYWCCRDTHLTLAVPPLQLAFSVWNVVAFNVL